MKVFEVVTEHCKAGSNDIIKTVRYVTSEKDTLLSVTKHFTNHCKQYKESLKGINEVLTIVNHITS